MDKLDELKAIINDVADLNGAIAVLGWDQQTYMPQGGAETRGEQTATLSRIKHNTFTQPRVGELLEDLEKKGFEDPDSVDARMVKVTRKEYDKSTKVTVDWVTEYSQVTTLAYTAWEHARAENDFSKFQPYLEKVFELRKQYADFFKPYDHVYDPLLDDFEPGLKTAEVKKIFGRVREKQVDLLKRIREKQQVKDTFIMKNYDQDKQLAFGKKVITSFGYDWNCGRQDIVAHPFSTTFGYGDIRITTRFLKDNGVSGLFSTMHEAGHAMYEQGIRADLKRSLLFTGASMAIHESQSRMWENLVGRSKDFWIYFYPEFQKTFPEHLASVSLNDFYKGINKVEPSLVRVEADEATYNLHVMLRLEIEIALLEGSIDVKDLPEIWNTRMKEYLGVTPPNDAKGVLQDVHWSAGYIGYFPTYSLGNLISAQLWEKINREIPGLSAEIRSGKFESLLDWLRRNIHQYGAMYEPKELILKVTSTTIDPDPYLRYLENKFSEIYGL